MRRAFLDAIGTLPAAEEARAFVADRRADKRARLVEALLARPEYVDYWTLQFADLLQNRKERDHDVRGSANSAKAGQIVGVQNFEQLVELGKDKNLDANESRRWSIWARCSLPPWAGC